MAQFRTRRSQEEWLELIKLRIPKSLHKSLSEHSKAEGISMNQYCLYGRCKNRAFHFSYKTKLVGESE